MRRLCTALAGLALLVACAKSDGTSHPRTATPPATKDAQSSAHQPDPAQGPHAQTFAEFAKRVEAYVQLHNRLERTLPPLPKETNPTVIDTHQRALGKLVQQERKGAKRGDIFTPDAERAFRAVLTEVFGASDGKQLKASIMDENPVAVKLSVNGRYPDEVPLSTVPPQVLAALPKLPPDIEYRFIGDRLILLDVHAHVVVDYIDKVFPV